MVTARELAKEGHMPTVFEQGTRVGGVWVYTDKVEEPHGDVGEHPCRPAELQSSCCDWLPMPMASSHLLHTGFRTNARKHTAAKVTTLCRSDTQLPQMPDRAHSSRSTRLAAPNYQEPAEVLGGKAFLGCRNRQLYVSRAGEAGAVDERVHSSMYANLRTNLPREVMSYTDFPFTQSWGDPRRFCGHAEVRPCGTRTHLQPPRREFTSRFLMIRVEA